MIFRDIIVVAIDVGKNEDYVMTFVCVWVRVES